MKRYLFLLIPTVAALIMGCEKNEAVEAPVINIELENNTIDVAAEGGNVPFNYTVTNPRTDGKMTAAAEKGATWFAAMVSDTQITVVVTANDDTESRSAKLNITYTYGSESVIEEVTVNQEGSIPDPEIVLENTTVAAPAEGGELAVDYTIENAVEGGKIDATTNYDWISGISCSDTQITFSVSKNTTIERSGTINVVYTYNDGRKETAKITVEQALFIPDPTISVVSDYSVTSEGGKQTIPFTINDPVAGGMTTANCEGCDWITELTVTQTDITFNAAENTVTEARSAVITVTYTYNENETVTKDINVTQAAFVSSYDHYIPDAFIAGVDNSIGTFVKSITMCLSDKEIDYAYNQEKWMLTPFPSPDSYYVSITLEPGNDYDASAAQPTAGTYNQATSGSGTKFSMVVYSVDADGKETQISTANDGILVIEKDGLQMDINLTFTDANGETYQFIYSGDYTFPHKNDLNN